MKKHFGWFTKNRQLVCKNITGGVSCMPVVGNERRGKGCRYCSALFFLHDRLFIDVILLKCFGKLGLFVLVSVAVDGDNLHACARILELIYKAVF